MSEWNAAYAFDEPYQDPNMWNGELNSQQYSNQNPNYHPTRQQYEQQTQGSQYVSFNEFLSQMEANGASQPNNSNFNISQYADYSSNLYNNYNNMPSSSQSNPSLDLYQYDGNAAANVSNGIDTYQLGNLTQSNVEATPEDANYTGDVAFKSNLTATATEFVPKATTFKQPANPKPKQADQTESSTTSNGYNNRKNHSASERNWRERPSSNTHLNEKQNGPSHKNHGPSPRNQESNSKNRERSPRNQEVNYKNQEPKSRNKDRNYESNPRNQEPNHMNHEGSSRYQQDRNSESGSRYQQDRNNESGLRYQQDRNNESAPRYQQDKNNERGPRYQQDRNNESGPRYQQDRNNESGPRYQQDRNNESGPRYQQDRNGEGSSRYQEPKENNKTLSKSNSKTRNKQTDDGRTFYNSSASKSSQDVRIGRGEGSGRQEGRGKNWVGSQRVRASDRNYVDDEQFANNYHQYREERHERTNKVQDARSSPLKSNKNKHSANHNNSQAANTEMTQRERLSEQLDKGTLECLVCCERVKQTDTVWSCSNCYHVLHLRCIRKWAMSSMLEGKWRCPACQNQSDAIPTEYRCMCGATRNPEWQRGAGGAHTCGRACARPRPCVHPCTLLCHPGPCPPCQATVRKQCGCGAETRSVMCSSKLPQTCAGTCRRKLNCEVHECGQPCHEGSCADCAETITQVCHCPASASRSLPCTRESARAPAWCCGDTCGRVLACGAHVCRAPCHAPPCAPCAALPATTDTCPCGKTRLEKGKRKVCTDPIPLCGNICAKPLPCGPPGDKHFCKSECHEGACPGCPDKTMLQCRCGHSSREVLCSELPEMIDNVFCQKKCNKKLSCGRHRCRTLCCAAETHRCPATCGRSLPCQLHRCEELCHTGHCPPCPIVSFEELPCACGAQRVLPPVRCGTRPPPCTAPCRRDRACRHPPHHTCHAGACPPCVVLTTKRCHGDHEERKTIPCSQEEFSCGLPCGKPLPCGKHTCIKVCHKGPCDTAKCTQPCLEKRPACGHPCGAACHWGAGQQAAACPSAAPCRRPVRAVCPCARRAADRACHENMAHHNKMLSALAASKVQEGGSVDLSELTRSGAMLKTLECDDECRVEQRTRQMALALQIRNPDVSAKLAPRYSDHVRQWAQRDAAFARHVHDKLTDLVQLAKKSKQKTRSHSFPSMNWQKRQFIHELCEHFGCESVAYDAEPNRNVVATADKEKSWLPAMSVLEVLAREAGKRRVPGPVLRPATSAATAAASAPATAASSTAKSGTGWATLTSTNAWAARSQAKPAGSVAAPKIDYFDNPPE